MLSCDFASDRYLHRREPRAEGFAGQLRRLLTLKSGPSSIGFALFEENCEHKVAEGGVDMIGRSDERAWLMRGERFRAISFFCGGHGSAMRLCLQLAERVNGGHPRIVAHRVRQRGVSSELAVVLDDAMLMGLERGLAPSPCQEMTPAPSVVEGLRVAFSMWPLVLQILCFEGAPVDG